MASTKGKVTGNEVNGIVKIITPWNPNNKVIPNAEILKFLQRKDVILPKDLDFDLFRRACVHKSYVEKPPGTPGPNGEIIQLSDRPADCLALQKAHNEELECVGDSVLDAEEQNIVVIDAEVNVVVILNIRRTYL